MRTMINTITWKREEKERLNQRYETWIKNPRRNPIFLIPSLGLLYLRILDIVHQIRRYFNPFPRNKLCSSALEIESKDIGAK